MFLRSFYTWYRKTLRNPRYGWLIVAASIIYLFSPIDISPDLIPILGQVDDVVIITILATEVLNLISGSLNPSPQVNRVDEEDIPGETVDVEAVSLDQ